MQLAKHKNLIILFFTLVIVMMGMGMMFPILPFYIESMGASGSALGMLVAIFALMQFIFAPLWGSLSDRVGRRPLLMLGMLGNGLAMLLFGLSSQLWMLFVSRALAGILSSATMPTAMAYISDSTNERERGGGMGIIGAAMGVGMVLGPGFGGLLGSEELSTPFFVAAGLSFLALLLIVTLLPESLPTEARRGGSRVGVIQLGVLWRALFGPIGILLVMAFLLSFALTCFESVFGLYAMARFDYGPARVGTIMMVVGLGSALGQGALTGPLTRRWGEAAVIKASLIASSAGFLVMLLATTFPTILLSTGAFVLANAMLRPAVISLASKQAPAGQGATMGLANSFMSLGRVAGPVWAGSILDYNVSYPYLSGSAVMLAGFVISLLWVRQPAEQDAGTPATGGDRATLGPRRA